MSPPSAADPSAANPSAAAPSDRPARRSPTPTKRAGGPTPGAATKASSDSTASGEARVAAAAPPPAPPGRGSASAPDASVAAPPRPAPKPQLGTNLYDVAWTPDEQATLEAGLTRYDETRYASLWRYIKIAAELPAKGVRDVALRVRWMRRRGNGASGGNGSGNASGKRQKRGQHVGGEIAAGRGGARANAGAAGSGRPPSVFEMRAPASGFAARAGVGVAAPHHHPAAFGSVGSPPHGVHPAARVADRRHRSRPGADAYVVGGAGAGGGMGTGQIVGVAGPGPGPGGVGVRVGTPVVGTPVGIGVPGLVPVPSGMRSGGGTIGGGVGGGDDDARGRPSTTAGAPGGVSRSAGARARRVPTAIGVHPVNPQHQNRNQNHPAAMGPGVSGAGVGVRFHQGGAASVWPRRASIALTEHGGADFFRSGRGLPGSVSPEVAATLEANVALIAEIRAVNRAESGNPRAAAMKNAERMATLRDNLVRVTEAMRDAPGIMARMPQLPARLDLALADATLRPMERRPEEGGARSEGAGGAEGEGEGGAGGRGGRGRGGRRGRRRAKS